jgi:hypothetical protein
MKKRKPAFLFPERLRAELTDRTERSFLFPRPVHRVTVEEGFAFRDKDGTLWRPARKCYDTDGASVPHPLDWLVPALGAYRYRCATMLHDAACRYGELERFDTEAGEWRKVRVPRALADELLRQGVLASGGWRITAGAYWAGVRVGAGGLRVRESVVGWFGGK